MKKYKYAQQPNISKSSKEITPTLKIENSQLVNPSKYQKQQEATT